MEKGTPTDVSIGFVSSVIEEQALSSVQSLHLELNGSKILFVLAVGCQSLSTNRTRYVHPRFCS